MFDVFEFLRNKLGCMYISDLKIYPYKEDIIKLHNDPEVAYVRRVTFVI